jgi:hypothetical protein
VTALFLVLTLSTMLRLGSSLRAPVRRSGLSAATGARCFAAANKGLDLMDGKPRIVYTLTDEAPALATYSLYPLQNGAADVDDLAPARTVVRPA